MARIVGTRFPSAAEARELLRLREQAEDWNGRSTTNSPAWWARREFFDYIADLADSGVPRYRIGAVLGVDGQIIGNRIVESREMAVRGRR